MSETSNDRWARWAWPVTTVVVMAAVAGATLTGIALAGAPWQARTTVTVAGETGASPSPTSTGHATPATGRPVGTPAHAPPTSTGAPDPATPTASTTTVAEPSGIVTSDAPADPPPQTPLPTDPRTDPATGGDPTPTDFASEPPAA